VRSANKKIQRKGILVAPAFDVALVELFVEGNLRGKKINKISKNVPINTRVGFAMVTFLGERPLTSGNIQKKRNESKTAHPASIFRVSWIRPGAQDLRDDARDKLKFERFKQSLWLLGKFLKSVS
jgi:hypothetical protein